MFERPRGGERALLVRIGLGAPVEHEDLEEFSQLADSAGVQVVATVTGRRDRPEPRFFVGSGKADEIKRAAIDHCAAVILVDHALTPSQERNLEKLTGLRVLDRNALILDIFAQRARSHEGKLEVELAQLRHLSSRLVRGWTHLERQKGGIGLRGPGETQLETDRRLLGERVRVLGKRLEKLKQQRETGRQRRVEIPIPSVALVGYTNAGKSTLFRALTGADAYVADQLFATLDPLVRRVSLPGGAPVVLADTVGFIRELPHELVAAFQSTLTEAREATLLLHVVDASDPRRDERIEQVNAVLAEVGAGELPQIRVFNKIDRLELAPHLERDADGTVSSVWISAVRGAGLDTLLTGIAERLSRFARLRSLTVSAARAGAIRARLFAAGVVRGETVRPDGSLELLAMLPDSEAGELARLSGVEIADPSVMAPTCASDGGYLQSLSTVGATEGTAPAHK
ncbi:MAG: ribosome rescue GTPase HflX [Steroidobacteraceae bacterium]